MTSRVDVKVKWQHEEKDFTPWLAVNLYELSRVIGEDLELEGTEVSIGPYRADIVARLTRNGTLAVIENQLTHADPKHLGQLVSYVARKNAKVGVWVATDFWHTNLCAIGSLNKCGRDSAQYFAVHLSLIESDSGTVQPVFNVREHPKNWQDPLARKLWKHLKKQCPNVPEPSFNPGSNLRRGRYYVKEADLQVVQHFDANFVRVYVAGGKREPKGKAIARISPYRSRIVASLGSSGFLDRDDPHCKSTLSLNAHDQQNWSGIVEWLDQQRVIYVDILKRGATEGP